MVESEYEIKPVTNNCTYTPNASVKIINEPGSNTNNVNSKIDNINYQSKENSKYDTIQEQPPVEAMHGGIKINKISNSSSKYFTIIYKKNTYELKANDEEQAIQYFLSTKNINQDELLSIYEKKLNNKNINNKNINNKLFLIRNKKKNINIIKI